MELTLGQSFYFLASCDRAPVSGSAPHRRSLGGRERETSVPGGSRWRRHRLCRSHQPGLNNNDVCSS